MDFKPRDRIFSLLLLITGSVILSGCNTQSSIRSSAPPFPGTTAGSTGIPSPQPGGSGSASGGSGRQSTGAGQTDGSETGTGDKPGTSTTTGTADRKSDAGTDIRNSGEAADADKSDDEILAEALDALSAGKSRGQETSGEPTTKTAGAETTQSNSNNGSLPQNTGNQRSAGSGNTRGGVDGRLEEGLAEFDDMILGKRQEVATEANAEGAGPRRGYADEDEDPLQTAMLDRDPPSAPAGNEPGAGGVAKDSVKKPAADLLESEVPDDVGDGQDDDIIARQLREAAMKEKDPELQAKLWEEYRKYKKDLQAKT